MSKMGICWKGQYIIEKKGDGKYLLFSCGPEIPLSPSSRGEPVSGGGQVLFRHYADGWLSAVRCQVKESTYMKYWNLVNTYIVPELGDMEWGVLSREQIEIFCRKMLSSGGKKQKGLSAKTVSDIMSVIRQIFRYASDHGAAELFNISSITIKKEIKEMRVLSEKEQKRLFQYLCSEPSERNLGLLICLFTGLRLGELCALRWEDISFSEQTIYVHQTMQRIQTKEDPERKTKIVFTPPKSGSSVRRIPIPGKLAEILFSGRKKRTGYVLTGHSDTYVEPRTMERHLEKILRKLGMEHINFHALRHTFATRCVEMDFDVKSLSEILGHANVNITLNRYVHPTMGLKRRNMQKLSVLLAAG